MGSDKATYSDVLKSKESIAEKMAIVTMAVGSLGNTRAAIMRAYLGHTEEERKQYADAIDLREAIAAAAEVARKNGTTVDDLISDLDRYSSEVEEELRKQQEEKEKLLSKTNWGVLYSTLMDGKLFFYDPAAGKEYKEQDALLKRGITEYFFAMRPRLSPVNPSIINQKHIDDLYALCVAFYDFLTVYIPDKYPDSNTPVELWDVLQDFHDSLKDQQKKAGEEKRKTLDKVTFKHTENIIYPLDKLSLNIWSLTEEQTKGTVQICTSKRGSKDNAAIMYKIDFDALGDNVSISKRLTRYDERVYIAMASLLHNGNEYMSYTQIFQKMGYTGKPNTRELERIKKSVFKMGNANVYINNKAETKEYGYMEVNYSGHLLAFEHSEIIVNGKLAAAAIHLLKEPIVIEFARQRKHVTTISEDLLKSPLSMSEQSLKIEDYLLTRLGDARNRKKQSEKILFKTICEKAEITAASSRKRLPEKVRILFDHYRKCGAIARYSISADAVTFHLPTPAQITGEP